MKRSFIKIIKILLFIIAFGYALYAFLPWDSLGRYAMSIAHNRLERQGMRLNYSAVTGEKGSLTIDNLTLSGVANISLNSITIKPQFLETLLNLALICEINFVGANVRLGQILNFGDGSFLLRVNREEILLDDLTTNGDFALNGFLSVNLSTMKIGRSDARLNVPENFEQNMTMLQNFLPLVQENERWYLRRR